MGKRRKKSDRQRVIDRLDDVFSLLVRERASWTCEGAIRTPDLEWKFCGKYYPEGHRRGIHCSHHNSRRHVSTRWHPDNASAHCYSCHRWLGGHPHDFSDLVKRIQGDVLSGEIHRLAHTVANYTTVELGEMYQHYRSELKKLKDQRADGVTGRIDFVGWD